MRKERRAALRVAESDFEQGALRRRGGTRGFAERRLARDGTSPGARGSRAVRGGPGAGGAEAPERRGGPLWRAPRPRPCRPPADGHPGATRPGPLGHGPRARGRRRDPRHARGDGDRRRGESPPVGRRPCGRRIAPVGGELSRPRRPRPRSFTRNSSACSSSSRREMRRGALAARILEGQPAAPERVTAELIAGGGNGTRQRQRAHRRDPAAHRRPRGSGPGAARGDRTRGRAISRRGRDGLRGRTHLPR